jgi:GTP cyclohydrolase I
VEEQLKAAAPHHSHQHDGTSSSSQSAPTAPIATADLEAAARAIEAFLSALGHPIDSDPQLRNTGRQVASAFHEELLCGYAADPETILSDSIAASGGDLIVVKDLAITCMCPHHLLPATGVLHLGYLPGDRIVGFGALERLAHALSRRLILQETLCEQIADALVRHLGARGAGCIAELQPTCLVARGRRPAHARVVTAATSGIMRDAAEVRAEFFALAQKSEPGR